ncbi:MAG: glycosyltransferase family 1 protein [Hyphomonadaceae bacterium]|jgi:glycosyltransferase involved in cell wall biosynthesis|nr:glycosyltransferase family 1 protein [Hyphomonadaceae bacterium]
MRIMLVTDAWEPQVNGVVRSLSRTIEELRAMGHKVELVTPYDGYRILPLPTYPEIKMAIGARQDLDFRFETFQPEAVHIATEGTLGLTARRMCIDNGFPFSTSYHTQYPEYITARFPVPLSWGYAFVRWFHSMAGKVMVATPTMKALLESKGFKNLALWTRGVDTDLYTPARRKDDRGPFAGMAGPIFLYVGRVAVEKNVEAFLKATLPGTKVVVGDGPAREELARKFKDVHFLGAKFKDELADCYANADVFVFPSLTDTFGLVILEAMASGTPVAAFDAPGPADIIPGSNAGVIGDDLQANALACLTLDRGVARAYAETYSWRACAEQFLGNLDPLPAMDRRKIWKKLKSSLAARRRKSPIDPVI